jgi:hypothetical protein
MQGPMLRSSWRVSRRAHQNEIDLSPCTLYRSLFSARRVRTATCRARQNLHAVFGDIQRPATSLANPHTKPDRRSPRRYNAPMAHILHPCLVLPAMAPMVLRICCGA